MNATIPFRDTFWNIPIPIRLALYLGGLVATVICLYGIWQRVQLWRQGAPENRFDRIPERLLAPALGKSSIVYGAKAGA
mgnify:CR=1 FL=1